ncbi:hypothetical protein FO519_000076 [Halicephalobus sp. NKZ332]|nr:hypothetical protein FO519_000076 [Halicephalobus sp. NKZ332]
MTQDKATKLEKVYTKPLPAGTEPDVEFNGGESYFFQPPRKIVGYSDNSASLFLYIIVFIAIVVFTMAIVRYLLAAA